MQSSVVNFDYFSRNTITLVCLYCSNCNVVLRFAPLYVVLVNFSRNRLLKLLLIMPYF